MGRNRNIGRMQASSRWDQDIHTFPSFAPKGRAMYADARAFLHMDEEWLWRFYLLDRQGNILVISHHAYFTRAEAEAAMLDFQLRLARVETGQPQPMTE
jgi:hypothetical protein